MPYYIQNPALQGFQEGNQTARQNMGIFGGMMENYLNNAAAAARQQAQMAKEMDLYRAFAAKGFTPSGQQVAGGEGIAGELTKYLQAIYEGAFGPGVLVPQVRPSHSVVPMSNPTP